MNSNFFNMIGLGNIDIGYLFLGLMIVCLLLLIMLIVAFAKINSFTKKYKKFMQGKNASSLEKDIMALYEDNVYIKTNMETHKKKIDDLYHKHETTFQKMGLVKYDAFKEMGGKLSFAVAILDEKNNGFIINSVHSGEGCYSYSKRIKNGSSEIPLSTEEKVAIERATGKATTPDAE